MFKVPAKTVDYALLKQYDNGETVSVEKCGSHVIIGITADCEEAEEWWEESQKISKYMSFRDDLMSGDYRCLYIAWLAGYFGEAQKKKKPPIPPGMKKLSGTLRSFIDFMYLDAKQLQATLESASDAALPEPTLKEIKDWVANLPDKDRQKILVDLLQKNTVASIIQRELQNRFLKEQNSVSKKVSEKKVTAKKVAKKTTKAPVKKVSKKETAEHVCRIVKNDPVRENRIDMEIVVDAYDSDERVMGWYYSIGDTIEKNVRCRCRKTRSMSPLKVGDVVDVLEIAPADDCESEMFVMIEWNDRKLAVPLEQLEPIQGDPKAIEIIEDWLYWCLMGYEF